MEVARGGCLHCVCMGQTNQRYVTGYRPVPAAALQWRVDGVWCLRRCCSSASASGAVCTTVVVHRNLNVDVFYYCRRMEMGERQGQRCLQREQWSSCGFCLEADSHIVI